MDSNWQTVHANKVPPVNYTYVKRIIRAAARLSSSFSVLFSGDSATYITPPTTYTMSRAGQIALITAGTVATGILGYVVYFDYMRRNSSEFRKGLSEYALQQLWTDVMGDLRQASAWPGSGCLVSTMLAMARKTFILELAGLVLPAMCANSPREAAEEDQAGR